MKSKVSIIIPAYNCVQYIEQCLCSVIKQTYSEVEMVIIDDGSTDGTGNIVDQICQNRENAIVIHQVNQGVSAARNKGIECASGKYILFLDSDDYLGETYVEKMLSAAELHEAELVVCGYQMVDINGNIYSENLEQ